MPLEFKSFDLLEAKAVEQGEQRTVMGYGATYVKDSIGDRIIPGAFGETIERKGPREISPGEWRSDIKFGYNHAFLIGLPVVLREEKKGLWVEGRVDRTAIGNDVYIQCQSGTLDKMSFAYDIIEFIRRADGGRDLLKLELYELGPVDWACNQTAVIAGTKSADYLGARRVIDTAVRALREGKTLSRVNLDRLELALAVTQEQKEAKPVNELEQKAQELLQSLKGTTMFSVLTPESKAKTPMPEEDEEEKSGARPAGGSESKAGRAGAEQKRHPATADSCARLHAAAETLMNYWSDVDTPPSRDILGGVADILDEVSGKLRSMAAEQPE